MLVLIHSYACIVLGFSVFFLIVVVLKCEFFFFYSGWINGIRVSTDTNVAVGAFMLIVAFLFSVEAVVTILLLTKVMTNS